MTPSIRNSKTRQRRKERGMVELRVWLEPDCLQWIDDMARRNDCDRAAALRMAFWNMDRLKA